MLKDSFQALHQCLNTCSILQQTGQSLLDQVDSLMDDLWDEIEIACDIEECLDCDGL